MTWHELGTESIVKPQIQALTLKSAWRRKDCAQVSSLWRSVCCQTACWSGMRSLQLWADMVETSVMAGTVVRVSLCLCLCFVSSLSLSFSVRLSNSFTDTSYSLSLLLCFTVNCLGLWWYDLSAICKPLSTIILIVQILLSHQENKIQSSWLKWIQIPCDPDKPYLQKTKTILSLTQLLWWYRNIEVCRSLGLWNLISAKMATWNSCECGAVPTYNATKLE